MSIILHMVNSSTKDSLLILIGEQTVTTVKTGMIECGDSIAFTPINKGEIIIQRTECAVKNLFQRNFPTYYLCQRHRIGGIAVKRQLIDIDANAKNTFLQSLGRYGGFDKRTTNFTVTPIHIVGPFQRNVIGINSQGIAYSQSAGF